MTLMYVDLATGVQESVAVELCTECSYERVIPVVEWNIVYTDIQSCMDFGLGATQAFQLSRHSHDRGNMMVTQNVAQGFKKRIQRLLCLGWITRLWTISRWWWNVSTGIWRAMLLWITRRWWTSVRGVLLRIGKRYGI